MISSRKAFRIVPFVTSASLTAALILTASPHFTQAASTISGQSNQAIAGSSYGQLPLSFIANAGQFSSAIRFQVRDSAGTLSFTQNTVNLNLPIASSTSGLSQPANLSGSVAIQITFDQANPNAVMDGLDQLPGIANFFIGNDPTQWHSDVPMYGGIRYHDLYPGVDLEYKGHADLLKGTYTLAAGADLSMIRWHYQGANSNMIDAGGNLQINGPDGMKLTEQAPIAWQPLAGVNKPIAVKYQIDATGAIQFSAGNYDKLQPLVIDPGLVYSTYLGGSSGDYSNAITVDSSGNAYLTGQAISTDFPTTPGVYSRTLNGTNGNVFVSKLNPTGSALIYSTFFGGSGHNGLYLPGDIGYGIAVDSSGDAYITGRTASSNFPTTTGAFQTTFTATYRMAFVTKLNPTGSALVYSSYLGGNDDDVGYSVAVNNGNAYVTGAAFSTNFPVTTGAFQTTFVSSGDAFVTEMNTTGTALVYSTLLGGSSGVGDIGIAIAVDSAGNAYVAGNTTSATFPTTTGAFQTTLGTTAGNGFVTKLNPAGSTLVYSTYLGGNGGFGMFPASDNASGIAIDGIGNAYITGTAGSPNFPTTSGAFQTTLTNSTSDAFVTKLNPTGTGLIYSTFLGGSGGGSPSLSFRTGDNSAKIAIDASGNAIITGATTSSNFPLTADAFQSTFFSIYGNPGAFVTKFNANGSALLYSTYLGQMATYGAGIALDAAGNAYVTGGTNTNTFPTTPGSFQIMTGATNLTNTPWVSKFTFSTHRDTIGVFRHGTFYLRLHNNTGIADLTVAFSGGGRAYPVVGDWTGADFDTVGTYNQSNGQFSLCTANSTASCAITSNVIKFVLGNPNDAPLAGRWLSSATSAGVGVFRPSNGLIYLKNALTTGYADYTMVLGIPGDVGLAGDWNGKGYDSPGVFRTGNVMFYVSNKVTNGSVIGDIQFKYGLSGDVPIVGDWLAQGRDGVGLFRKTNNNFYLKNMLNTGNADTGFVYGIGGDVPVAGHWQAIYPPAPTAHTNPPPVLIARTPVPQPPTNGGSVPGDAPIGD